MAIAFLTISCSNEKTEKSETKTEEHNHENVVLLNGKQEQAIDLKLGTLQKRNLTTAVKVTGQLAVPPDKTAEVSAIIGGNVKSINIFKGDRVKKGTVLAVLEHPDYITLQEDYAVTSHKLEFLKKEYERQKELYEQNVGSGKEYQKAKAEYFTVLVKNKGLKERLLLLNLSPEKVIAGNISNTVNILSPINGFVNEIKINLGTYVAPKDIMFEISDNNAIHADFIVYEKDIRRVKPGQKIHFTVANNPDKEYIAEIFAVEKKFNVKTRAIHIHAKIKDDVSNMMAGMYISGHIHTDKIVTDALPEEAIVKEGEKSFIFVLNDDNKNKNLNEYKITEVITGVKDNGYVEVHLVDSLPDNAKIVLNAAYYLLADMKKEETGDHD